jgi:hypothetical protein
MEFENTEFMRSVDQEAAVLGPSTTSYSAASEFRFEYH